MCDFSFFLFHLQQFLTIFYLFFETTLLCNYLNLGSLLPPVVLPWPPHFLYLLLFLKVTENGLFSIISTSSNLLCIGLVLKWQQRPASTLRPFFQSQSICDSYWKKTGWAWPFRHCIFLPLLSSVGDPVPSTCPYPVEQVQFLASAPPLSLSLPIPLKLLNKMK
jgi:hypothetical protein